MIQFTSVFADTKPVVRKTRQSCKFWLEYSKSLIAIARTYPNPPSQQLQTSLVPGFMISRRVGVLIRTVSQFSLQRHATFSSSSAAHPRFSSFSSDEAEEGSVVYRHKLKTQRPTTIRWERDLVNSVSLIGTVEYPLKRYQPITNETGVYTLLRVEANRHSNHSFRIMLVMRGDMATLCEEHLKPNDFIYVAGCLGSYTKYDRNKNRRIYYKVDVKDLNYVAKCETSYQKPEKLESGQGEVGMEKYENRFYLWHLYFTNPYEWWDNRNNKRNLKAPDFKHKDTGEALWLRPDDPPWIKKQLQLVDSKMAEQGLGGRVRSHSSVSTWVYDEFGTNLGL